MRKSRNMAHSHGDRRRVMESLAPVEVMRPAPLDDAATGCCPREKILTRVGLRLDDQRVARVVLESLAHEREVTVFVLPRRDSSHGSSVEAEIIGEPGRVEETLHCLRDWGLLVPGGFASVPAGKLQAG